ncbi:MAG TPA: twin-arginine translocase subunit TatC [Cyclobacteriaceae bacterium]|nr:twin-arginine translocase subunit TatC [Cyclobacteriaceae bacterium]
MPLDQESGEPTGEAEMTFLDHLEELRWHVIRSVIALMVFTGFSFLIIKWVFNTIILGPAKADFPTWRALCKLGEVIHNPDLCIQDIHLELQSRSMTGQFSITIVSSIVLGLVMAFPYVIWELWRFVKPGLKIKERNGSRGVVGVISMLFGLGISFGYYVVSPLMVYILVNYKISDMIVNQFDVTSYVSTLLTLVLGSGALFQLPVVIYFLTKLGLVTPMFLRQYRKHAVVVILVIAAIITPPDVLSQVLITIPLYLLFEISILISANVYRRKLKEEAEEELNNQTT